MIKVPRESFSQLRSSTLNQDRRFRSRKKSLRTAISATSLSRSGARPASSSKKRTRQQRSHQSSHKLPAKRDMTDTDFGLDRNLGYSSFGAYTNNRNPANNSPAAAAARKHQAAVAAARSDATQHTGRSFTSDKHRINSVPRLSQYTTPSQRITMAQIPEGTHRPRPTEKDIQESRKRAAKREAYALRILAQHAGLGKTKIEFRSDRVAAEFALTEVTAAWKHKDKPKVSDPLPSVEKIEKCLKALSMMPSHLAVVVPTLRRAIYSNDYAGVVAPETQPATPQNRIGHTLTGLPYFGVCEGLETSNKRLLSDVDGLKDKLEDMQKDRDAHAVMLRDSNGKIKELREKVVETESKNKSLKKQLVNMREIASDTLEDNEGVTKRFVDLDQQHGQLRTEHKNAKKELADLREVYSNVSDELSHAIRNCGR